MFLRNQFGTNGIFDFPVIKKQEVDLQNISLIGYDQTKPNDKKGKNSFVHFFLDDYKFGAIWNDPEPRIQKLRNYKGVLSPQFSTYYTMPSALQIYNTFRSRWCGAYLQANGITVIPTVSWGLPSSYIYCFDGIEKGSVVAVSTLGVKREKDFFLQGYNEMLRRINPRAIICYSSPFEEMKGNVITVDYAETNNLKSYAEESQPVYNGIPKVYNGYIKWKSGYVITARMGGSGSGNRNHYYDKYPKSIHEGRQNKHIVGSNNYTSDRSIFSGTLDDAEKLVKEYSGTGQYVNDYTERVDFGKQIGYYVNRETGERYPTTVGTIRYSKKGTHIVPARPKE